MSEQDNHRRWNEADRGVYEVWYMTWNDPASGQGYWLRYITESPATGEPRGELWFARFDPRDASRTWAIHKHVPMKDVASGEKPFGVAIAGNRLGHDHAVGQLAGDGHHIRWDLRWDPASETVRFLPDAMYVRGGIAQTTVHSPNIRVPMSGTLVIDGETIKFDRVAFGQTHVWGKKHAYSWVWGHCNTFAGAPDGALEILGVQLQRRGITTPRMFMLVLNLDGEKYRLNQFRHVARNRGVWGNCRTDFVARSATVQIEGSMSCTPERMVAAPYEDPDGENLWCMNTMIGDARIVVSKRAGLGWREHRVLEAAGTAHFELGDRTRDPAVTREHILVR